MHPAGGGHSPSKLNDKRSNVEICLSLISLGQHFVLSVFFENITCSMTSPGFKQIPREVGGIIWDKNDNIN